MKVFPIFTEKEISSSLHRFLLVILKTFMGNKPPSERLLNVYTIYRNFWNTLLPPELLNLQVRRRRKTEKRRKKKHEEKHSLF